MRFKLLIAAFLASPTLHAMEINATRNGQWQAPSNWSCDCIPGNTDHITIPAGIKITSTSSIALNFGPKVALMIDGTLELSNSTLLMDVDDIVAIGEGGRIAATGISAALYLGTVNYFISVNSPVIGPASISAGNSPKGLSFFKAMREDEEVLIRWRISESRSDDVFTLQRSQDGIHYQDLTEVYGGNDEPKPVECSWYDARPLKGLAYYRLLLTDGKAAIGMTVLTFAGEGARRRTY